MATKVGEVFIELAVDAASGNLSVNELVSALGKLDVVSVATVGGLTKIATALIGLASAATSTAVEMSVLQDVTGADPKIVQQWEKAAQRINIHAGSVTSAIRGVNKMMASVALGESSMPMELSSRLGITPYKVDGGKAVNKDFFDIIKEIAKPSSEYWRYNLGERQRLLEGAMPGANAEDMMRLIQGLRSGTVKPENMRVLEDQQVKELTDVRRKEIEVGQRLEGIFQQLLTGGGAFARVLDSINVQLEALDKWLASKQGKESIDIVGREISGVIRNKGNPMAMGRDIAQFLDERFYGVRAPAPAPFTPQLSPDSLTGRLDINILGAGGQQLGRTSAFLGTKVTHADVESVTVNAGNGGLGQ